MPGYNGTGPAGDGPMTGRGRGYCIMELPENGKLPEIVSEVLSEIRDHVSPDPSLDDAAQLGIRVRQMQFALRDLDHRIEILKKSREKNMRS